MVDLDQVRVFCTVFVVVTVCMVGHIVLVIPRKSLLEIARASFSSTVLPGLIPSWHGLGSQKV